MIHFIHFGRWLGRRFNIFEVCYFACMVYSERGINDRQMYIKAHTHTPIFGESALGSADFEL